MKGFFSWKNIRLLLLMVVPIIALVLVGALLWTNGLFIGRIMMYVGGLIGVFLPLWSGPVIRSYFNKYGWD